jgi:micrococcal nuclease
MYGRLVLSGWAVLLLNLTACPDDSLEHQPVFSAGCVIDRIADGDTVTCTDGTRIRLIGIDAPELDQPPFGEESRVALEALLPSGRSAGLELDVETRDDFGRTLAYLWDDETMINEAMIRQGWALAFTIRPNVRYEDRFRAAEGAAMQDGAGHWGTGGFACRPVEHRMGNC